MTVIPPYLKPGDTIGIVFPSAYMPAESVNACIETLRDWGFRVKIGKTLGHQYHYFSGTDEERLQDFQDMMDDEEVDAILCGRGGYGMGRIIDRINFTKFITYPKWIVGFSDITVLHNHLYSNYKISSLHAPMAAAFNEGQSKNQYIQSLREALIGKKANYLAGGNTLNRPGKATGIIVGGNLSLLTNMIGTASDIKTKNRILFIEGVDEYIYHLDRMMRQLKRSGKLDDLKGLIIGKFSGMKDTDIPFGQRIENEIQDLVKGNDYPVCFGFPVSHDKENYALKISLKYQLHVEKEAVRLREV